MLFALPRDSVPLNASGLAARPPGLPGEARAVESAAQFVRCTAFGKSEIQKPAH